MELATLIDQDGPPRTLLDIHLCRIAEGERLDLLLHFIQNCQASEERLVHFIWEAWDYIKRSRLWITRYRDLEELRSEIEHDDRIKNMLCLHEEFAAKNQAAAKKIYQNWRCQPDEAMPEAIQPPQYSSMLLYRLVRLSKLCSLDRAVDCISDEINKRQTISKVSKSTYVLPRDVQEVLKKIEKKNASEAAAPSKRSLQVVIEAKRRKTLHLSNDISHGVADENEQQQEQQGGQDSDEADVEEEEDEGLEEEREGKEDETEVAQREHVEDDRDEEVESEEEEEEEEDLDKAEDAMDDLERIRGSCSCPEQFKKSLRAGGKASSPRFDNAQEEENELKLIGTTVKLGLHKLCHAHLRLLASDAGGLKNNLAGNILRKRLNCVWQCREDLNRLKKEQCIWFRASTPVPLYRFMPRPTPAFHFSARLIFERFAGAGTWTQWKQDGTIIIPKFFSHLVDDRELFQMIEDEFDMYQHHYRPNQEGTMGWLRIMYHSLTQQAIRQDPAYYAVSVASRPDKQWRLISYPYYTKDTRRVGEKTGFHHLDLNVSEFLKTGKGENIVQGCTSLDDETNEDCTTLIIGFHRSIRPWWARVVKRKAAKHQQLPSGQTTNIPPELYTSEDSKLFGSFSPSPCGRGGIRITRPDIAHGSTATSHKRRRLVFPWYTGIADDLETLDNQESETWSQIAACHRDMVACQKSPSGRSAGAYGRPSTAFPAAVKLPSTSAIGDALMGARRWNDPMAERERDRLFGSNEASAKAFVREVRARIITRLRESFSVLLDYEQDRFGADSFFEAKAAVSSEY
ncbi:MAG: gamma-tubulin [Chaenotheca gracillima]|nr:MAG: gamma-tubulin [Chaenotheca gracillima]